MMPEGMEPGQAQGKTEEVQPPEEEQLPGQVQEEVLSQHPPGTERRSRYRFTILITPSTRTRRKRMMLC